MKKAGFAWFRCWVGNNMIQLRNSMSINLYLTHLDFEMQNCIKRQKFISYESRPFFILWDEKDTLSETLHRPLRFLEDEEEKLQQNIYIKIKGEKESCLRKTKETAQGGMSPLG